MVSRHQICPTFTGVMRLPAPTCYDRPDGAFFNAEHFGKSHIRFSGLLATGADLIRYLVRELRVRAALQVETVRHWFQMIGVYAGRHSAKMVKFVTLRNLTDRSLVGLSVSQAALADSVLVGEKPVAESVFGECPDMAWGQISPVFHNPEVRSPLHPLAFVVSSEVAERLTLYPSKMHVVAWHEARWQTTAALAKFRTRLRIHVGLLNRLTFGGAVRKRRAPTYYARPSPV